MGMERQCQHLLVLLCVFNKCKADVTFLRTRELDDRTAADGDDVKQLETGVTSLQCGHECSKLDWCLSFSYRPSQQQCQMLNTRRPNGTLPALGMQFWVLGGCPVSEGFLPVPGTPYCLLLATDVSVTHDSANTTCQLRHSQLLSLDSMEKFLAIRHFLMDPKLKKELSRKNWLDGRRPPGSNKYEFELSNRQPFPFGPGSPAWVQGQPNNLGGNQRCLGIVGRQFDSWRLGIQDSECEVAQGGCICEKV